MQAGNDQLQSYEEQDRSGHAKKLLQVNTDTALHEHHAEQHGGNDAQKRSQKAEQFSGIERDRAQDQDRFDPLAENHQKDKKEKAYSGVFSGQRAYLAFDLAFQLAPGAHHENDHADHE